jgi:hypothetical protein
LYLNLWNGAAPPTAHALQIDFILLD